MVHLFGAYNPTHARNPNHLPRGAHTTGTSSGIGRTAAVYLARKGFTVLAGVRKDRDAQALKGGFGVSYPVCVCSCLVVGGVRSGSSVWLCVLG